MTAEARYAEAEPCLRDGYDLSRVRGEHATDTREARRRLEELYEARGRQEETARADKGGT